MITIKNFINGSFCDSVSGDMLDVFNPAEGTVYAKAPDSGEEDAVTAIEAAKNAFPQWAKTSSEERCRLMMKLANLIDQNVEKLAEAESIDSGKPYQLAKKVDIARSSSNFRFFATAIMHFASEAHETTARAINYTLRRPLGVVTCISPWNLPLYLLTWKIAPAIAAGNTVVAKPSEVTPMTAFLLSSLIKEAGIPDGVVNILHGQGHKLGKALCTSKDVKAISFTGSTNTGAVIAGMAAPLFKKLSLEMGGKNPNIIFADCNYDNMLKTTVLSSFTNQGQVCLCGSRIYIEESLYERFKNDFVMLVSKMKVGNPKGDDTKIGAVVSAQHKEKILSYIKLAKEEGGTVLLGGKSPEMEGDLSKGYFIEPTIIEGLSPDCRVNMEEVFGPVVTLTPFKTEKQVIEWANGTDYGLSASVWTENLSRTQRITSELETGIVWVNTWMMRDLRTPFGGVKNSGVGREGGVESLRFFTEPKNVCIQYQPLNQ